MRRAAWMMAGVAAILATFVAAMPAVFVAAGPAAQAAVTDPAPRQPVLATIFAAGDIADCRYRKPPNTGADRTAAIIDAGPPDALVLTLGDHVYPVASAAILQDCYEPTWGRFRARTRPVAGNHDYAGGQAAAYYHYFGAAAGPRQRGYYSFALAGWHLVALNSHLRGADADAQLLWLKDDLARHPARCTLAYWHVPLYSSGGHGVDHRMREAWRVLHQAGAELVLSGHDHDYERFAPMDADGQSDPLWGMRQFVAGTGGGWLTPFLWGQPGSEVRFNDRHGVLKLELLEDGYRWEFAAAMQEGPELDFPRPPAHDSGSARCH